ncbi:MAG TPA: NAD(P)/FAD-dependent oxidoreductase, partial [Gammaproteobacteria bacterium]|nr:NAD(P)/FAD-dependent oxidoreductase [Gammaproteobacteria bacterium]
MSQEHIDVLIIGAGISGIGAGYYLKKKSPNRTFKILESRKKLGGTWDLFKYPGIRSDSDMTTMGFRFKPWKGEKVVADGDAILDYLNEVVDENGFRDKIQFNSHVMKSSWNSSESRWYVTYQNKNDDKENSITCNFLYFCVGYYDYENGHDPHFQGQNTFSGKIVHPQHWPEDLDYKNKNVVVIGSGATAVTLIPSMANETKHITMLQRSPTYYMVRPNIDPLGSIFRKFMGKTVSYFVMRWKNIQLQSWFFKRARKYPDQIKQFLIGVVEEKLDPSYDIAKHFTPSYNPWEQRLCLVPDGDLFDAINKGKASVVTDHIDSFTPDGIKLKSGEELPADIIVTATGLKLMVCSNIEISVDDKIIDLSKAMTFKGMMVSNVPNVVWTFGYTNASWTLRA